MGHCKQKQLSFVFWGITCWTGWVCAVMISLVCWNLVFLKAHQRKYSIHLISCLSCYTVRLTNHCHCGCRDILFNWFHDCVKKIQRSENVQSVQKNGTVALWNATWVKTWVYTQNWKHRKPVWKSCVNKEIYVGLM